MRTTVAIDDELLNAARAAARRRGYTLGRLVEDALRRELAEPSGDSPLPLPVFGGGSGPRPGVDLRSNRALAEHGCEVVSYDRDFARFPGLRWSRPGGPP